MLVICGAIDGSARGVRGNVAVVIWRLMNDGTRVTEWVSRSNDRDRMALAGGPNDRFEGADHFEHLRCGDRKRLTRRNALGESLEQESQGIGLQQSALLRSFAIASYRERGFIARLRPTLCAEH